MSVIFTKDMKIPNLFGAEFQETQLDDNGFDDVFVGFMTIFFLCVRGDGLIDSSFPLSFNRPCLSPNI